MNEKLGIEYCVIRVIFWSKSIHTTFDLTCLRSVSCREVSTRRLPIDVLTARCWSKFFGDRKSKIVRSSIWSLHWGSSAATVVSLPTKRQLLVMRVLLRMFPSMLQCCLRHSVWNAITPAKKYDSARPCRLAVLKFFAEIADRFIWFF